jgi:hypothetical protein
MSIGLSTVWAQIITSLKMGIGDAAVVVRHHPPADR